MNRSSLPKNEVLELIHSTLKHDKSYKNGNVISTMCTYPDTFAQQLFSTFIDRNIGDANLFPGVVELENEVISSLGELLHNPDAYGNIVTGGTEANFLALWAYRELSGKHTIIVPETAHFSLYKSANILNLKTKTVKVTEQRQMDIAETEKAIDDDTFCIVGIAGTTELGVIDPISELSALCLKYNLYLHIDAAFGGFVIPFMKDLGYDIIDFDFSLPGVSSITIDPHKMGLCPIPAGGILFRNEELTKKIKWSVSYLSGGHTAQTTFVSSRSGAAVIAVWGMLNYLGYEGYNDIIKRCMHVTDYLVAELDKFDELYPIQHPTMNIVGVASNKSNIVLIAEAMRDKGWAISLFTEHLRIVLRQSVTKKVINKFIHDIKEVLTCIQAKI
ncbi:MAG: tyrosine decarboxylase MfnA [Candidatus Celaenobacter antarcticus]|nr:tyrosine decarboxylase MfnA [Candidatus Celaenobacter antarcticus]MDP8313526.1 tyrosine decarboxylase MfnA [Candidatus Celaenobacter antarcticus]